MGASHLALATQYVGKNSVGLCDTKFSTRLLFRLLGYKTFADVEAAASTDDQLGGVIIATPTPSHGRLAKWAIKKGLPCFIEKPLTLDVNASNELKMLAMAKGVPVQVGFVLRYVASFQRLRNLVQCDSLGSVISYTASMRGNVIFKPPTNGNWKGIHKMGGGCLNEYGPHIIDLCQFIFGQVKMVKEVKMAKVFCTDADDRMYFEFCHRDGGEGKVEIDWCDSTKRKSIIEFKVKFKEAEVRVDNSAVEINWNFDCALPQGKRLEIDAPIRLSNVSYYLRGEEFSLELEDFIGTCVGRRLSVNNLIQGDTTPRLEDGLQVDLLIEEIARKAGLK